MSSILPASPWSFLDQDRTMLRRLTSYSNGCLVLLLLFLEASITYSFSASLACHHGTTSSQLEAHKNKKSHDRISSRAQPIDPSEWPSKFPAKESCSKCGLCETSFVEHVKDACAFLDEGMSKIDSFEPLVHGRSRKNNNADEQRFGVLRQPIQLVRGNVEGSQWTGATTGIALSMLETQQVDAVICVAGSDDEGQWSVPRPIIARTKEDVLRGRGVKPSLSPNLNVLDELQDDPSIKNLLFCGVGCAVQAFRAVRSKLQHVETAYVLGTNCADNAPTPEAATAFIRNGMKISSSKTVKGYEFMQDYKVHVKIEDSASGESEYVTKPYFSLPAKVAEPSIAYSCRECFDYTNGLADVVIGYMGAPIVPGMKMDDPQLSQQTLTVRNDRGLRMVRTAVDQGRLWINPGPPLDKGGHEGTVVNTVLSDTLVLRLVDDDLELPEGMPQWLGNALAAILGPIGPQGLAFARYSIDYHILRNYFHVLHRCHGNTTNATKKLPQSSRSIVRSYLDDNPQLQNLEKRVLERFQSK